MGDEPSSIIDTVQKQITEAVAALEGGLDQGLEGASVALRSTTATVKGETEKTIGLAKEYFNLASEGVKHADEQLFAHLKQGLAIAVDHENASIAAAVGLVAIALPAPRRLLWRLTFGRFRSAEAMQAAAEQKMAALAELVDAQAAEAEKVSAALAQAREEYSKGAAKLTAAAAEVRALAGKAEGAERKAQALMRDLRELRSKHALQMRSDLAVTAATAARQKASIEKVVTKLAKDGF